MARIDQEEIDRIKRETDIVALIQSSGTTLKRRESKRGEWIGCCPVHDDKDPSLCVNSDKNVWICNGESNKQCHPLYERGEAGRMRVSIRTLGH